MKMFTIINFRKDPALSVINIALYIVLIIVIYFLLLKVLGDTMNALEIMTVILSVFVLIKLIVLAINPKSWMKFAGKLLARKGWVQVIYLILALIAGYYLFQHLTIVEVLASTAFISLLIALAFIPYSDKLLAVFKKIDLKTMLIKSWLPTIIWLILIVWGLVAVFS